MKGVLFNIVEVVVTEHFGPDTWDDLLSDTGLNGAYTALGNYDDLELVALVGAASRRLDLPVADVLRFVGRYAFVQLAQRYPGLSTTYHSSRDLLHHLDNVIHPQVLALYPGSEVPSFEVEGVSEHVVVLRYRSGRSLCHLAEGLVVGAAEHYGETVSVHQEQCRIEGGAECRLVVAYEDLDG